MQLLRAVEGILQRGGLGARVWMRPYHILCCGPGAGLIEMVADCASIDQVKKRSGCEHLGEYFTRLYGPPHSPCLEAARRNFLACVINARARRGRETKLSLLPPPSPCPLLGLFHSCAGPSCRTRSSRTCCRCATGTTRTSSSTRTATSSTSTSATCSARRPAASSPRRRSSCRASPSTSPLLSRILQNLRTSLRYVDLLGARYGTPLWDEFRELFAAGFELLHASRHELEMIVRLYGSSPLDEKQRIAREIEKQFATLDEGRVHPREFAFNLIAESVDSWRTKGYDWYQLKTNGIRI